MVENSKKMRKAFLGFLLAAKLNEQKNYDWRKSRQTGEDLFVKGEAWEQELQSEAKEREARLKKNTNPKHDPPSSQETDISKSKVQSD